MHFIGQIHKCLFSFSQDCSLLSRSLTLEALLIGVHCEKQALYKCIDTIQYNYDNANKILVSA